MWLLHLTENTHKERWEVKVLDYEDGEILGNRNVVKTQVIHI